MKVSKNGDNFESDDEETNVTSFISKQDSANVQNINGQEFDVIDVGGEGVLVNSQHADQQDEVTGAARLNAERRGAIGVKKPAHDDPKKNNPLQ